MKTLRTPLFVFISYMSITLLLHVFGPWKYTNEKIIPVVFFVFFAVFFFYLGYISVIRKNTRIVIDYELQELNFKRLYRLIYFGLYVQIFLLILIIIQNVFLGNISLGNIDPGSNYADALERNRDLDSQPKSIIVQIKTLLSPFFYLTNVLIIYYFSFLSKKIKSFFVVFAIFQVFTNFMIKGAQKDIFDLFLIISSVFLLKTYNNSELLLKFRKFVIYGLVVIVFLFAYIQFSRLLAYGQVDFTGTEYSQLDMENILFDIFGFKIGIGLSILISYVSQGYYGLSLCLQLPFEWTYGIGNSFALTSYFQQYFGFSDGLDFTYPFRMENQFGIDATMFWHTVFPWLASDITFPGTIILMFLIGRLYAKTILESIKYSNPFSITLFYFLNVFLIYVPANNQLMQTRDMMIGFVVILGLWMFKRKKFNFK